MASTRKGYPAIPAVLYWALRQRFVNAPPRGEVSKDYLSSALGISPKVAANTLPAIRQIGLIDDENRPTELAGKWRDDARYAEAAREMVEAIYPQGLKDVSPPDTPDFAAAQRWFLNETGAGAPRAKELARFYVMLARGELAAPGERPQRRQDATSPDARPARRSAVADNGKKLQGGPDESSTHVATSSSRKPDLPQLSIAIQVYVDKGMTAEQVDHVFASMARHLYGRE